MSSAASSGLILGAMTLMEHSFIEKCRKSASYTKFLTGPAQMEALIEIQKKVAALLGNPIPDSDERP
mgnify:CR=1 FL=1